MEVSSTLRLGARGEMGTHLRMNTQVLPGAQSQPQKRQLLTLLLLIEVEQLSQLFDHLFPWRTEGDSGVRPCPAWPSPFRNFPSTPQSYEGNQQGDQQVLQDWGSPRIGPGSPSQFQAPSSSSR